jgi:hypothetical protein
MTLHFPRSRRPLAGRRRDPGPTPHRLRRFASRLVCAGLLAGLLTLILAPCADAAAAAPTPTAAVTSSASPAPSGPGIGLGPGAPTGAAPTTTPAPGATDPGGGSNDPGFFDIPGQIEKSVNDWFASLIASALTPMLDLVGDTLLGTPDVTVMPRIESLWTQMALLADSLYILLVLAGAVIVMTHGTMQSRHSAKEIVPRLLVGMIAGNASMAMLALMIHLSDALALAVLGTTINPATAGAALSNLLNGNTSDGIFLILLDIGAQVMLIAILLTYIIRVALTMVLAVAAPLALSLHALPQTDHLARLWWRAITGCFLVQLGQSLTFVLALDVMLDPSAASGVFGLPSGSELTDVLVFLALAWILIKIPTWVGRSVFGAGGGSMLSRLVKTVIAYKTLGMLKGKVGAKKPTAPRPVPNRPGPGGRPGGAAGGLRALTAGPGPGGGGGSGVTWTVTQEHPPEPTRTTLARPVYALEGQGPRLALPPGAPPPPRKPRHQQMTLPIKAQRVPRPAPAAEPPAPPRARSGARQQSLFPLPPRTPPTAPTAAPITPVSSPPSTAPRMSAATRPIPPAATTTRAPTPTPGRTPAAPSAAAPARMSAPPPPSRPAVAPPARATPAAMPARRPVPTPAPAPAPTTLPAPRARRTPTPRPTTSPPIRPTTSPPIRPTTPPAPKPATPPRAARKNGESR